ncbi:MAG: response regulator [Proteobacteria bacterium]|nr:response regulator [Pseudomonadota bacterium]
MAKVLFVDDEPDIELLAKQKFRKQIADGSFEILFAQNGQEALDLIALEPDIAVVVSDVNMPQMDGLTLLDKLKDFNPTIKTIVVSAYGDTKTLRSAMNMGVFDFVTKPIDFNELANSIERSLVQYAHLPSSLYNYQLQLVKDFPAGVNLNDLQWKGTMIWDAFTLNFQHLILLGIYALPSPVSGEIVASIAHGILKTELHKDMNSSLTNLSNALAIINDSLKVHALVGQYHLGSLEFAYRTNGDFKVHHISSTTQTQVIPSHTTFLKRGDVVTFEREHAHACLSLTC